MSDFKYPGVFLEESFNFIPSVVQVNSAIPVFIGYTERHHFGFDDFKHVPKRISSITEYEAFFGGVPTVADINLTINTSATPNTITGIDRAYKPIYNLYYSLQLFYANGGGDCYIISVGTYKTDNTVKYQDLEEGLESSQTVDEITLIVCPDAPSLQSHMDCYKFYQTALIQCAEVQDRFLILDTYSDDVYSQNNASYNPVQAFRDYINLDSSYLGFGAAYYPYLKTIININYRDEDVLVNLHNETFNLHELKTQHAEVYRILISYLKNIMVVLPPSGAIAGLYVSTDRNKGVWKAPANASLNYVLQTTQIITTQLQTDLTIDSVGGKSINPIQQFHGRGTMVWGARTLAGNDNQWRYIAVKRCCIMLNESITKALLQFNKQQNNKTTWSRVEAMINNYLKHLFRQGAFAGAQAKEAYYVTIGLGKTMSAHDIANHQMIVNVGVALIRPYEFIPFKFVQEVL